MTQQLCVVPGCGLSAHNFGTFLFNVPSDVAERETWRAALGASSLTDSDLVCWSHFELDSLRREGGSFQLVPSAIPAQFLGTTELLVGETPDQFCRLCAKRVGAAGGNDLANMLTSEDSSLLLTFLLEDFEDSVSTTACDECFVQVKCSLRLIRNCKKASEELDRINLEWVKATEDIQFKLEIKEEFDEYGETTVNPVELEVKSEDSSVDSSTDSAGEFECTECTFSSMSQQLLGDHMRKHHNSTKSSQAFNATSPFQCPECPLVFETRIQLANHQKQHIETPKVSRPKDSREIFECEFCDYKCKNQKQLSGHRKVHAEEVRRNQPARKIYQRVCPICGKVLAQGSYKVHMKSHNNQRDYPCGICDKKFFKKKHRDCHVESVHEKKTWECNICGVKHSWRHRHEEHMLKHKANAYKHSCARCDKKFLTQYKLKLHMTRHMGPRVFCEICNAGFSSNYHVKRHQIRVHKTQGEDAKLQEQNELPFSEETNYSSANDLVEQCELPPPQLLG